MPFLGLENVVFIVKKVSFLSRTLSNLVSSLILTEKKNNEKIGIFEQKHGLTSLEKFVFLVKKVCLLYDFNSYFDQKQKMEKMEFFCSEAWVNPFGKIYRTCKNFCYYSEKKFLFSLKSRLACFLVLF